MVKINSINNTTAPTSIKSTVPVAPTPLNIPINNNIMQQHAHIGRQQDKIVDFDLKNILEHLNQSSRSLENRKLSLTENGSAPSLSQDTHEDFFAKKHGIKKHGLGLNFKAKQLQRSLIRKLRAKNNLPYLDDDDDNEHDNPDYRRHLTKEEVDASFYEVLGKEDDNPSNKYAMLGYLLEYKQLSPTLKHRLNLQESANSNYKHNEARINADYNIINEAGTYGGKGDPKFYKQRSTKFMDVYYSLINAKDVGEIFSHFYDFCKQDIQHNSKNIPNKFDAMVLTFKNSTNLALLAQASYQDQKGQTLPTSNIDAFIFKHKSNQSVKPSEFMHDANTAHASLGFMDKQQKVISFILNVKTLCAGIIKENHKLHHRSNSETLENGNFIAVKPHQIIK